jgi:isoleucyl-tRNA synthetase
MPFGPVDPDFDLVDIERRGLQRWEDADVEGKARVLRQGGEPWVFYEGPPTANGRPGLHHVWARAFKDLYPRFRTMQGYDVPRKGGWDCHGLPVELAMEKELGLHSKGEIEAYGIAEFNDRCRQSVQRYVEDWSELTRRAGVWIDTADAYWTLDNDYIESVWWLLRQMWDRDLLYEGHRVSPYCARCGTALSSHELGQPDVYRDVTDPSAFVRFPIVDSDGPADGADLLVWTTTPWTLVSNVAAAVGPDIAYVRVPASAFGSSGRDLILAEALVPATFDGQPSHRWIGQDMQGMAYERPYSMLDADPESAPRAWKLVVDDFVSTTDGSGIVHLAPAFGEDDARIGRLHELPVLNPVGPDGTFDHSVAPWAGTFVKDADLSIIDELDSRGLLVRHQPYEHSYPHCWRCSTPLIYWAKTSWFVRTSEQRPTMIDANETINWQPPFIKEGRFGRWLETNVDWALSRDRYWGTPLPIWRCDDCGHDTCVGSVAELSDLAGSDLSGLDLHRPHIDAVVVRCGQCGGRSHRLAPVLDAWFDSGAMPSAQHHFPFNDAANNDADVTTGDLPVAFPADFICEAIDQTRGWFYSLLAINSLVFGQSPFRNVVCLALVVDEHGTKMSKSRGNVIDPFDIFDTHGADALRWYFFSQGQPWTTRRVFDDGIREATRQTLLTLWNIHSFFTTYANLDGFEPDGSAPQPSHVLDRWVLSELDRAVTSVTEHLTAFDALAASTALAVFIDDLSNWYVRRSRPRFWKSSDPEAHRTLHHCLVTTARLLAPFCPMLADEIHTTLTDEVSVHLTDWPTSGGWHDETLASQMATARRLVSLGRSARTDAKVKVRQPLARALILHDGSALDDDIATEIRQELNVQALEQIDTLSGLMRWQVLPNFRLLGPRLGAQVNDVKKALASADGTALKATLDATGTVELAGVTLTSGEVEVRAERHEAFALAEEGGWAVALDLEINDSLRAEGLAREVVRSLNDLRKSTGLAIADRITVSVMAQGRLAQAIHDHHDWISTEVLATSLDLVSEMPDHAHVLDVDGDQATVTLHKVHGN